MPYGYYPKNIYHVKGTRHKQLKAQVFSCTLLGLGLVHFSCTFPFLSLFFMTFVPSFSFNEMFVTNKKKPKCLRITESDCTMIEVIFFITHASTTFGTTKYEFLCDIFFNYLNLINFITILNISEKPQICNYPNIYSMDNSQRTLFRHMI